MLYIWTPEGNHEWLHFPENTIAEIYLGWPDSVQVDAEFFHFVHFLSADLDTDFSSETAGSWMWLVGWFLDPWNWGQEPRGRHSDLNRQSKFSKQKTIGSSCLRWSLSSVILLVGLMHHNFWNHWIRPLDQWTYYIFLNSQAQYAFFKRVCKFSFNFKTNTFSKQLPFPMCWDAN